MKISLALMTRLMRRVSNNPFASAKTRARNLLLRLQEEGYEITLVNHPKRFKTLQELVADLNAAEGKPAEPAFDPLHASIEADTYIPGVSYWKTPRDLYDAGDFSALHAVKRAKKKSFAAMGFSPDEIQTILSHT